MSTMRERRDYKRRARAAETVLAWLMTSDATEEIAEHLYYSSRGVFLDAPDRWNEISHIQRESHRFTARNAVDALRARLEGFPR